MAIVIKYFGAILIIASFVACSKDPKLDSSPDDEQVIFSLKFTETPTKGYDYTVKNTRSAWDEIQNINLYIWNDNQYFHTYTTDKSIALTLPKGLYELRIVANYGYDLNNDLNWGMEDSRDVIPYLEEFNTNLLAENPNSGLITTAQQITLSQSQTYSIPLTRIDARIDIALTIADSFASDFEISRVSLRDIPNGGYLFPDLTTNSENCFLDLTINKTTDNNYTFYCNENIKPSNPDITTQQEKTKNTAPNGATYILITGFQKSTNSAVDYRIYCGRNTTTDFTIQRNTATKYNITILNANTTDVRIENASFSYMLSSEQYIPYYGPDSTYRVNLGEYYASGAGGNMCYVAFSSTPSSIADNLEYFDSKNQWQMGSNPYSFWTAIIDSEGTRRIPIRAVIKPSTNFFNNNTSFTYKASAWREASTSLNYYEDDLGSTEPETKKFVLTHTLHVDGRVGDASYFTFTPTGGTSEGYNIDKNTCLLYDIHNNSGCSYMYDADYFFADSEVGLFDATGKRIQFTGDIHNCTIKPQYSTDIYVKPIVDIPTTELDLHGTSNCYQIDMRTDTESRYYTFDATTIGNGVYMVDGVNILPAGISSTKIAPTKVKCLWGEARYLTLENGRVKLYLPKYSDFYTVLDDMVIAACDNNDNILWSWHILFNYDNVNYAFDDYGSKEYTPNRGIDNQSYSIPGQFQWGRKDPLYTQDPFVETSDGATTISSSIQYPTKYSTSPSNWLGTAETNFVNKRDRLWGGANKIKTIYDPCPVGYKVSSGTYARFNSAVEKVVTLKENTEYINYYYQYAGVDANGELSKSRTIYYSSLYWTPDYNSNGSVQSYTFTRGGSDTKQEIAVYSTATSSQRSSLGYVRCTKE